MTTFAVNEDQALADALTAVIGRASTDVAAAAEELRSAATPDNGYHLAHVDWQVRRALAATLREVAADGGPAAGQLEGIAAGLDDSVAARAANGQH